MTILEILWRRGDMRLGDRLRGLQVWFVMWPLWYGVSLSAGWLLPSIGLEPLFSYKLGFEWAGLLAVPLATFLAFLWADFFFYWFHRFQHRFLWRFHSIHHSVENLSAVNSYHHWSEPFFWVVGVTLPMMVVELGFAPRALVIGYIFTLQPTFIHSATRLNFGPLGGVLVDNRYHRIHHSLDPAHHHKNFGAMTPLWDWVFRTRHMPAKDEWPATGLADAREPRHLIEWAMLPWRSERH